MPKQKRLRQVPASYSHLEFYAKSAASGQCGLRFALCLRLRLMPANSGPLHLTALLSDWHEATPFGSSALPLMQALIFAASSLLSSLTSREDAMRQPALARR